MLEIISRETVEELSEVEGGGGGWEAGKTEAMQQPWPLFSAEQGNKAYLVEPIAALRS